MFRHTHLVFDKSPLIKCHGQIQLLKRIQYRPDLEFAAIFKTSDEKLDVTLICLQF